MSRVSDKERSVIVASLREGKTPYAVAKDSGRSRPTVCKIARQAGIDINVNATKKATQARKDYSLTERLILLNEGFDKAREILPKIEDPKDLQSWMIAVATGIDKRRLEDGEATNRSETVDPERRQRMKQNLDEIAVLADHRRSQRSA